MKLALRLVLTVALLAIVGFCLFGFLATFEPLPAIQQWGWRGVYATVGLASVLVTGWIWGRQWRKRSN